MKRITIQEAIIVEGRDDVVAVKRAVEAEIIPVHGFGVRRPGTLELIEHAHKRIGAIVLTDPDTAGEHIRRLIETRIPDIKHAYIQQAEGTRASDGNIGVENATPEVIQKALLSARPKQSVLHVEFTSHDVFFNQLSGDPQAGERRRKLSDLLGIGHANGKQLVQRLNRFGITREEFEEAVTKLD